MIVWDGGRTERMCSPGVLDVREVRAGVRKALAACADGFDLDDVDLMVCEIATNAVRHSASGRPGGGVCVTVLMSAARLRVEIQDDGGSSGRPMIPRAGLGLGRVRARAAHGAGAGRTLGRPARRGRTPHRLVRSRLGIAPGRVM